MVNNHNIDDNPQFCERLDNLFIIFKRALKCEAVLGNIEEIDFETESGKIFLDWHNEMIGLISDYGIVFNEIFHEGAKATQRVRKLLNQIEGIENTENLQKIEKELQYIEENII